MAKGSVAGNIKLSGYDALFGNTENDNAAEHIIEAHLSDLHDFRDHPFRVMDDEKMEETTESIRQYGVLGKGNERKSSGV